jgi:hypothetical protein
MMFVVKKIVPSSPSGRENLRLKKYVIHDLQGSACVNESQSDYSQRSQSRGERIQTE